MGFISHILEFDKDLLLSINGAHSAFFDNFMFLATDTLIWLPFFLSLIYIIIQNKKYESLLIFAILIVVILAGDGFSNIIKYMVMRPRPTHDPSLMYDLHIVGGYRGGKYGFFSAHAVNTFSVFVFMSLIVKNKTFGFIMFLWASMHTYTRLYLGVHFPTDIIVGIIVGIIIGYGGYYLFLWTTKRQTYLEYMANGKSRRQISKGGFAYQSMSIVYYLFLFNVIFLITASLRFLKM